MSIESILFSILLIYSFFELFTAVDLIRLSLGLFRLSAVGSLVLLVHAQRMEVYVGAALFFGMITLVTLWSFRSEVQNDDHRAG